MTGAEDRLMRYAGLCLAVAAGAAAAVCSNAGPPDPTPSPQPMGYVLKRGDGESLYGGAAIIAASPRTGTQGGELFLSRLEPGASTGIHVHHLADEFFYVVDGSGLLVGEQETPFEAGDVIFVPRGVDHRLRVSGDRPLEIVFLMDRPGLADEFRENHAQSDGGRNPLTLEALNAISQRYGTTYKTIE
jgi:mannose-6-phosphate isomerase-like protein (cupin superfamily)